MAGCEPHTPKVFQDFARFSEIFGEDIVTQFVVYILYLFGRVGTLCINLTFHHLSGPRNVYREESFFEHSVLPVRGDLQTLCCEESGVIIAAQCEGEKERLHKIFALSLCSIQQSDTVIRHLCLKGCEDHVAGGMDHR